MPSVEMFRMLGSGTEAAMAAIRVARAYTGKKKVIKIGGAYHGWSDAMVYGLHVPGTRRLEAKGIPAGASKHTQEVFPNDLGALRRKLRLNRLRGGTAAVIVEPLGPESGTRPVPFAFNRHVRELCSEFDALLIFDEVVTGFRVGLGGAQDRRRRGPVDLMRPLIGCREFREDSHARGSAECRPRACWTHSACTASV